MRDVNPDAYGTQRPKVGPDDLEEDVAVLTITEYEEVEVDDPNTKSGKRMSGFLTFEETGVEKVVWLNKTSATALVEYYGKNPDKWIGEPCPVEKVKGEFEGKPYHKVSVVPKDAWHEYIDDVAKPRRTTRKTTKRKGAKRGRK